MSVAIATMTIEHYDAARALWERAEGVVLNEADRREAIEAFLGRNPRMSHVALAGERLVGALLCGHDGRRGYLHHLAVEAELRNRGVGRRLIEACLGRLREEGVARCNLFVLDDHSEARRFWQRLGWRERPTIRLMSRDLAP